jgi:DNA invertase Pin-like site-specific DNA recombinase
MEDRIGRRAPAIKAPRARRRHRHPARKAPVLAEAARAMTLSAPFADLPAIEGPTGRFMLQQMAAVAELEAGMISVRTKAALAAAKARGTKLGGDRGDQLTDKARALGCKALTARADARAVVAEPQASGVTTLRGIAAAFNARGIQTPRGVGEWQAGSVRQLLARLDG